MKTIQLRSPYHLSYSRSNLDICVLRIYKEDTTQLLYTLSIKAINETVNFEISELIRSKNDFLDSVLLNTRDTFVKILIKVDFFNSANTLIGFDNQIALCRDGYIERSEPFQIYKNFIGQDFTLDWTGGVISSDFTDVFGGEQGFQIELPATTTTILTTTNVPSGKYTFSLFVKKITKANLVVSFESGSNFVKFLPSNGNVFSSSNADFDVRDFGDFFLFQGYFQINPIDGLNLVFENTESTTEFIEICFPQLIKRDFTRNKPEDLLLQSNLITKIPEDETYPLVLDQATRNGIYHTTNGSFNRNVLAGNGSMVQDYTADNVILNYDNPQGQRQTLSIPILEVCEPKFEPKKVSFINKFGVVQDFYFFKKNTETLNVSKDKFKGNIIENGTYNKIEGVKSVYNLESDLSISLFSGFYSESYNDIFRQIMQSELVWIENDPVTISDSSVEFKTRVNDKLIEYTFNFEYANPQINNVR